MNNCTFGTLEDSGDDQSSCFGDVEEFCAKFGRLYTKSTSESEGLCPEGWRVPGSSDWRKLQALAQSGDDAWYDRLLAKDAWYFYKSENKKDYMNDEFGFSMLPAGNLYMATSFKELGGSDKTIYTHSRNISFVPDRFSIRCVK